MNALLSPCVGSKNVIEKQSLMEAYRALLGRIQELVSRALTLNPVRCYSSNSIGRLYSPLDII
jgi:hypothetical protein